MKHAPLALAFTLGSLFLGSPAIAGGCIEDGNAQIGRFTSAGERTRGLRYAYYFKVSGLPGLKFSAAYYHGAGIRAAGCERSEWEHDLRLDYVLRSGPLKGVGFTWRHGVQRGNDSKDNDKDEHRLIVSYSIALF